jgi:uncharacterized membrane protein YphA (DoxX/SURF4 family)
VAARMRESGRAGFANRVTKVAPALAFGALFVLAGYTFFDALYLTSTCFGDNGQIVCPTKGPEWARPYPASAAILGLLAGLAGLAGLVVGRRIRAVALLVGFLLVSAGLIASKVMSPGVASTFV